MDWYQTQSHALGHNGCQRRHQHNNRHDSQPPIRVIQTTPPRTTCGYPHISHYPITHYTLQPNTIMVKILPIHKDIPFIHNLHPQLNIPYMQCTNITRPPKCSTNACQIKKLTANYPTNYGKPHEYHMNTWPPSHENCQTQQSHTLPSPNTTTQQILTVLHLKSTQGSTPTHP